ncbi:fibrocystin-L-like [Lineus longissimus]|uniref:fibrocystin-L-like n=1 Tax=Lineus longissimus TaxID=88925 RepID=UPI00315DCFCB
MMAVKVIALALAICLVGVQGTTVSYLTPRIGSINGETRITLHGVGFAKDHFEEGKGAEVTLVSDKSSTPCRIHKDGCTETMIMCYTPKFPAADVGYTVKVKVDGVEVPDDQLCPSNSKLCIFTPNRWVTPSITSVNPRSGPPGTVVTMCGRIITNRTQSNEETSTNGVMERITRVYFGGQKCQLRVDDTDELYGVTLNSDGTSKYGCMTCKLQGTFVGNINGSFIIEGSYGRSLADLSILHVSAQNKIAMFQTYAEVDSVSPSVGSTAGGTLLTITGQNFDETTAPASVTIGGEDCVVASLSDTEITCVTPSQQATKSVYPGNRGVRMEFWNETSVSHADIDTIANMSSPDGTYVMDQAEYIDNGNNYVTRWSGFFVAPVTGQYLLMAKGDDSIKLYVSGTETPEDKTLVSSIESWTLSFDDPTESQRALNLTAKKSYYFEAYHRQASGGGSFYMGAKIFTSTFNNKQTGDAVNEMQEVKIQSTIVNEVQNISLVNWATGSSVNEVQTVTVDGTNGGFQLRMDGVSTGVLTFPSSDTEVAGALNSLPTISPREVTVTESTTGTAVAFTVTFISGGDRRLIEVVVVDGDLACSVTEDTQGVDSMETFQLEIDGVPSVPIARDADAATIEAAIYSIFSVKCPTDLTTPSDFKINEDYEADGVVAPSGTIDSTSAFCGRRSLKNPTTIFTAEEGKEVRASRYKQFCLAYKGLLSDSVRVTYQFVNNDLQIEEGSQNVAITFESEETTWKYKCTDLSNELPVSTLAQLSIKQLSISSSDPNVDLNVDNVLLAENAPISDLDIPALDTMRLALSESLGVSSVTVTRPDTGVDNFAIELVAAECSHNFPLLQPYYSQESNGVFRQSSWASGIGIVPVRTGSASPPVTGSIAISYKGHSIKGISAQSSESEFKDILEASGLVGAVDVTRAGTCAGYEWSVNFVTSTGDQPPMEIDQAFTSLSGISPSANVTTLSDGCLLLDPIPGDMLRTPHTTPQVSVLINNIPTSCDACDYEWSASAAPAVTSVSPSSGTENDVLTIQGTGFDATPSNNEVRVGDSSCVPQSATSSELTCLLGPGAMGSYSVQVTVSGKGKATGSNSFSYTASVTSVSPTSATKGGGAILTIIGTGLTADETVLIDGNECTKLSLSFTQMECEVPQGASAGSVSFSVENNGVSTYTSTFTYNSPSGTLTAVNVTSASVDGSTVIEIQGTGFGSYDSSVSLLTVGGVHAEIVSWTSTAIVAILPSVASGSYPLRLRVAANDYADTTTNSIPDITYDFELHQVSPKEGSLFGGTILTFTGSGFPEDITLYNIAVGEVSCTVLNATSTTVVGQLEEYYPTHNVDNTGTHATYGAGYSWNPVSIDIKEGDKIQWNWSPPQYVSGMNYRVCQTANASSLACDPSGFSSGAKTSNGAFVHQFLTAGEYFYWSDYVDAGNTIAFRGTVRVAERQSQSSSVSMQVKGVAAKLAPVSKRHTRAVIDSCSPVTLPAGCENNGGSVTFFFTSCATPNITAFTVTQNSNDYTIEMTGEGFGTDLCQHTAFFMDEPLTITSASTNSVVATFTPHAELAIGVSYDLNSAISLFVYGAGSTAVQISNSTSYIFKPVVSAASPTTGSCAGGAKLAVTGMHLSDGGSSVSINFPGVGACEITEETHDSLICYTPSLTDGIEYMVSISVTTPYETLEATGVDVTFTCGSAATPDVTAVDPTSTDGTDTLTISGSGFGARTADVVVYVGTVPCTVATCSSSIITCNLPYTVPGTQDVVVVRNPEGNSTGSVSITVIPLLTGLSYSSGSTNGGLLLRASGAGFVDGSTTITVDGASVTPTDVSSTFVEFVTPAHSAGSADINITSNGVTYPAQSFSYSSGSTPIVNSLSPSSGTGGSSMTISGSNFEATCNMNTVIICGQESEVTACSSSSLTVTLPPCPAGDYTVYVHVEGKGDATSSFQFTFPLTVSSMSPVTGSFGGGQILSIAGQGFDGNDTSITICGEPCPIVLTAPNSPTAVQCTVPAALDTGSGTKLCDMIVSSGESTLTHGTQYTYQAALTPSISSVSPARGGTGGGTTITINGSGFGTSSSDVTVDIAGSDCAVQTVSDTTITCITSARSPSVMAKVAVSVGTNGQAPEDNADFHYIDVWSSPYTWGTNLSLPVDGDMIVVGPGQTLMVDTDTAIVKMLLVQGGTVIFDEKDVELNCENILITDGGTFQIGTEAEPHLSKATITMHGNLRATELPIYGAKALAVRNGTLDLHGKPIANTWTKLTGTAAAGTNTLTVGHDVTDWEVGSKLILASTGHRHSQRENEELTIAAISGDGKTITLVENLQYEHLGVTVTVGGMPLEMRAEVGLLTHNILFRGSNDPQWNVVIEACPDGFDTGEFATQTCFQGRHGEEMGSDQFGGHIIMHGPEPNKDLVVGRIEHVELNYAGQAFRLGRYPIHFHLNGDMTGSYVKGCGIHETFNRAVNIHGTHNVLVEHNVIYNIMGGAFFLEDGIETGNIFQYNLAVFVKSSTSLLNDDITPAAFWVTNPNNTVRHNAAAGGTHFGFWYRMHEHPDGPSYDSNICPKKIPLLEFRNNTCHSQGWFGLWIFQEYFPTVTGACDDPVAKPAVYESLYAWNNEKGAEWVNCGAMQFKDFVMYNNEKAGIEMKMIKGSNTPRFDDGGAVIEDAHIVGYLTDTADCSTAGIVLPFDEGLLVKGTKFSNFDQSTCAALAVTRIDGTSGPSNGGWQYDFYSTSWVNSPNKCRYAWEHEGILKDMDGTLTGVAGQSVVPTSGLLPTGDCTAASDFSHGFAASVCAAGVKFHRFSFNNPSPESLAAKDCIFENQYGSSSVPFEKKRLTHKLGWMVVLVGGTNNTMHFENVDHITNISYSGTFYTLEENDCLIINHNFTQKPDRFAIVPTQNANSTDTMVSCGSNYNYDYYFDRNTKDLYYIISGSDRPANSTRKKRAIVGPSTTTRQVDLQVYRCWYKDCIPPPDPNTVPPPDTRPDNFTMWTDLATWEGAEEGYGGNCANVTCLPQEGDNIKIRFDQWVVINEPLPKFTKVYVYGVIEFNHTNPDLNVVFSATHIFVSGGRLIAGYTASGEHMQGQVTIELRGDHNTPDMPLPGGPNMGAKALGIFGGLDLHGKPRSLTWTKLAVTANQGDNEIQIADAHDWQVGEDIVIAPTGFEASECETARITGVSGQTITLNKTLTHNHLVKEVTSPELVSKNKTFTMAAEVGLLSRNVKVVGEDYNTIKQDAFGARVIMGTYSMLDQIYRGWARVSNVEFYRGGQLGWTDSYDPRYALVWVDTGDVIPARPSFVRDCAFHNGLAPAIGVFGSNKIPIENNVIHHPVGSGIIVEGSGNEIRNNLVTNVVWNGHYNNRDEPWNIMYDAGIQVNNVVDVVMEDNVVAGSERAGFSIKGEICDDTVGWKNNEAHSVHLGTLQFPGDEQPGCSKISGFRIWRAFDFGIYSQTASSMLINDVTMSDNGVGIYNYVYGPASKSHICEEKTVTVQNSAIIGDSGTFSCSDDLDRTTNNFKNSGRGRSYRIDGGMTGIGWYGRASGPNTAPLKPFLKEMNYPGLCGKMTVRDTLFYAFNANRCSRRNYVISTTPTFEDNLHPVYFENVQVADVDDDSKAFFHHASVSKANPADCVDMVCDAKQNCFIADTDGSFLGGSPGTIVAQAEYEWDGDARRGVGDYRIPKVALTDPQGNKLNVNDVCPNKGIVGTNACTFMSTWQAYKCQNSLKYAQLIIENMDHDTEERRLSPVALISPNEKYVNLLNGPQDHGWCNGYTCQKRLSTFWAMVALEKEYHIYFTSTSPEHLRLRLPNVDTTDSIKLAVYYRLPQRFDVYYEDVRVPPLNEGPNSNGDTVLFPPTAGVDPTPSLSEGPGANYFDRDYDLLYFIMKGTTHLDIKMSSVLVISFNMPAMTVDDFFGTEIVNNLAIFLGVPKSKIKFVSAVNAKTGSRRRRATDDDMTVTFEVGDGPTSGVNETVSNPTTKTELDEMADKITDAAQQETLGESLGTNVSNTAVSRAAPSSDSSEWGAFANQTSDDSSGTTLIDVPSTLVISQDVEITSEAIVFRRQPWLRFRDSDGNLLTTVGTDSTSWVVSASIRMGTGHADAVLTGTTTATFVDGIAKFTDLAITHHGKGYILDFNLTSPSLAVLKAVASNPKAVPKRSLKLALHLPPTDLKEGKTFGLKVKISDKKSQTLPDITWRGHNWTATVRLHTPGKYQGELVGNTTGFVDVANNEIDFFELSFTKMSKYILDVVMESSPPGYSYKVVSSKIDVKPPGFQTPSKESKKGCRMRFAEDYSVVSGNEAAFEMTMYNELATKYTTVSFDSFASSQGSVIVTFNVEGSSADTADTIAAIYAALDAGYTVVFNGYTLNADGTLEIDGVSYGVTTDTSGGLSTTEIIIIAVVCSVVVLAILTTVLVVSYIKNKNKKKNDLERKASTATPVQFLNDRVSSVEKEQIYLQWRLNSPPEKPAARKSEKWENTILVQDAYGRGAAKQEPMIALPTEKRATPVKFMTMAWDNPAMESDDDYDRPMTGTRSPSLRPGTASSLRRTLNGMSAKVQPSDDDSSDLGSRPGSTRTLVTPHMSARGTSRVSAIQRDGELRASGNVPAVE